MGTTSPVLDFDTTSFGSISWRVAAMGKKKNTQKKNEEHRGYTDFYNFVEKTLRSLSKKRLQVKKLTLIDCLDKQKSVSCVDRWINFLVESNIVEELSLDFQHGWYYRSYHLTRSVLVSKSLTGLSVCKCKLVSTSYGDINLPSLKKLYLCYVSTNDQIINELVAGCPVIEDMRFTECNGFKSIKFEGLTKAKSIVVTYNGDLERVELEAPNLYCLHIDQKIKNCEINLVSCNNVKMLTLSASNITDKWFHDYFSQLPLIEYLKLYACENLERLKISSHSLKTLYLMDWKSKKLVEVNIDTPNLRKFAYCSPDDVIPFFSNALALSEATYQILEAIAPCNVEKIGFLAKLNNSKLLTLVSYFAKVFFLSFFI